MREANRERRVVGSNRLPHAKTILDDDGVDADAEGAQILSRPGLGRHPRPRGEPYGLRVGGHEEAGGKTARLGLDPGAVDDEVEIGERLLHELPPERRRAGAQALAHEGDHRPVGVEGAAEVGVRDLARIGRGIERDHAATGEEAAIAHLQVAFAGQVLGQQDVVAALQLDMPIDDGRDVLLDDGRAVDEGAGGHQHLAEDVHADRVTGREDQVARGAVLAEGLRDDADRHHLVRTWVASAIDRAVAEPADRTVRARHGDDEVADREVLDSHVAARGSDARAAGETRDSVSIRVVVRHGPVAVGVAVRHEGVVGAWAAVDVIVVAGPPRRDRVASDGAVVVVGDRRRLGDHAGGVPGRLAQLPLGSVGGIERQGAVGRDEIDVLRVGAVGLVGQRLGREGGAAARIRDDLLQEAVRAVERVGDAVAEAVGVGHGMRAIQRRHADGDRCRRRAGWARRREGRAVEQDVEALAGPGAVPDDDVELAVLVHVDERHVGRIGAPDGNGCLRGETSVAATEVDRDRAGMRTVGGDDVGETIAVQVARCDVCRGDGLHRLDLGRERAVALAEQHGQAAIDDVAVGIAANQVGNPVGIDVGDDERRGVAARGVERLGAVAPVAVGQEDADGRGVRFGGGEVGTPVAIEIDDGDVFDRASALHQRGRLKRAVAIALRDEDAVVVAGDEIGNLVAGQVHGREIEVEPSGRKNRRRGLLGEEPAVLSKESRRHRVRRVAGNGIDPAIAVEVCQNQACRRISAQVVF